MMLFYTGLWIVGLPVALAYLLWRGRKDKLYIRSIGERFGKYTKKQKCDLWVHAVSLGEMRSAAPIIQRYLDAGKKVVVTNFTPAGRRATIRLFEAEITAEQLFLTYAPAEFDWTYKKFFDAFAPKIGLVMEIEIWPRMVFSAKKHKVPLFLCNAQYPEHSYTRDLNGLAAPRGDLVAGYTGILAKSNLQKDRFETLGSSNVKVMGETRFDQPISPDLLSASDRVKIAEPFKNRPIIAFASVVEAEEEIFISLIDQIQARAKKQGHPKPLFIFVPRAPERFELISGLLKSDGQKIAIRSQVFNQSLEFENDGNHQFDILIGDSIGEMYFYLNLSDFVVVSGGFLPSGAHNIIEPLALQKPTFVGPITWSIEYPAEEAVQADVLMRAQSPDELFETLYDRLYDINSSDEFTKRAATFFKSHSGATNNALDHLPDMLNKTGFTSQANEVKAMLK